MDEIDTARRVTEACPLTPNDGLQRLNPDGSPAREHRADSVGGDAQ
jgi:hypothetical protein